MRTRVGKEMEWDLTAHLVTCSWDSPVICTFVVVRILHVQQQPALREPLIDSQNQEWLKRWPTQVSFHLLGLRQLLGRGRRSQQRHLHLTSAWPGSAHSHSSRKRLRRRGRRRIPRWANCQWKQQLPEFTGCRTDVGGETEQGASRLITTIFDSLDQQAMYYLIVLGWATRFITGKTICFAGSNRTQPTLPRWMRGEGPCGGGRWTWSNSRSPPRGWSPTWGTSGMASGEPGERGSGQLLPSSACISFDPSSCRGFFFFFSRDQNWSCSESSDLEGGWLVWLLGL